MKKKWLIFIVITLLLATITVGTVLAIGPIRLVINGQEVRPLTPVQIVNNRALASVRQIAEALGATVEWDDPNQTVRVSNKQQVNTERRLDLLEFALVSGSPEEIANTWAKGVMSRNGALQYAVLCEDLRAKYGSGYESWNWVTGASSPWVDSYQVGAGEQQDDATWKFTITFHYTDSTKSTSSHTSKILVGTEIANKSPLPIVYPGTGQKWYVIKID